jgi:Tol biopolymer transport system component/DNA-binding winged helix-turn-helix (wHTH) protein
MMDARTLQYRFDDVEIDVQNVRVTVGSEVRPLEPKSFRLLLFLVENAGRAVSKDEIMQAVWPDAFVSDNSLARAITQIRKALGDDPKSPRYVETVPTIGYRFVGNPVGDAVGVPSGVPSDSAERRVSSGRRRTLIAISAGVCLVLAAGAGIYWILAARYSAIPYPMRVVSASKLTSYEGDEREPAVSPDGSLVAFSWSGATADNYDIYVLKASGQEPLRLTQDPAPESFPAWSADGSQIAFIRRKDAGAELVVVPALGGPERVLLEFPRMGADLDFSQHPVLTWSRDDKTIVYSGQSGADEQYRLYALSVSTGEVRPISSPESGVVGDSSPALSSDGRFLAFVRYLAPRNGRLLIQKLDPGMVPSGDPIVVKSTALDPRSPVWLEDGRQLLFADPTGIFQWDRDRGATQIYASDGVLGSASAGPKKDGKLPLAVSVDKWDSDIWQIPLNPQGTRATGGASILQRSTASDAHPDYSPDGRMIAFSSDRSGGGEIWIADADGSHPRQLTHLGAHILSYPRWSPDGTKIAFHARVPDIAEVYVVDVKQGAPRQITQANPGLALVTWSRDGKYLYASTLVGGHATEYRFPATGGAMQRLWDCALLKESVDGRYAVYWKPNKAGIFRRSMAGDPAKNPEELIVPDFWPANQLGGYEPVEGGIYYVSADARGKPGPFRYFDYATRKSIDIAPAAPGLGRGIAIAPDRRHIAFAASSAAGGDLLLLKLE